LKILLTLYNSGFYRNQFLGILSRN